MNIPTPATEAAAQTEKAEAGKPLQARAWRVAPFSSQASDPGAAWRGWLRAVLALALVLAGLAHAPRAAAQSVTCSATMTPLTFGSVSPLASLSDSVATLSYTCHNTANQAYTVTACFDIGDGAQGGGQTDPRQMERTDAGAGVLLFQLYQDPGHTQPWGSTGFGVFRTPYTVSFTVPRRGTSTGSHALYGEVLGGQSTATPGAYQDDFHGIHTTVTHDEQRNGTPAGCADYTDGSFGFLASASVADNCTVSASDISFGTQSAAASNLDGQGTVTVTCANGAAYNVGLAPSNGRTDGTGSLGGSGGNLDKVPYRLHQGGFAGPAWGNTATASTVGNGVHGVGSGMSQALTVYAVVPSANYAPDTYSDTVTVNVNY